MATEAGSIQFSIGSVLSSSFGVYARNFVSFTVLGLVIGLISLAFQLLYANEAALAATAEFDFVSTGLGLIVGLLVSGLTQAAVIYGTFQDLRGSKAGLGDCISRGLAAIIPVIVASLIFSIVSGIGFLLLLVPGIIVVLLWWLFVPAIVVEQKGIFESFGRSAELTKGRRWQILGLLLVMVLLMFIVGLVIVIGFVAAAVMFGAAAGDPSESLFVISIVQYGVSSIVTVFMAVVTAVSYYYLRSEKEGVGIEDLASVFD
jgi:hypothetical protein